MLHKCNVHCHALNPTDSDILGIEDSGKWLSFSFLVDTVVAIKQATDDEEESTFNCTTVFTATGETYVIDTPFYTFQAIWEKYLEEDEKQEDDSSSSMSL